MDQNTLNIAAGAVMGCLGWFARMLWDRQEAQAKALEDAREASNRADAEVRIMIAQHYVTHTKLGDVIRDLKEDLTYIRDRLDETPQRRQSDPRPSA